MSDILMTVNGQKILLVRTAEIEEKLRIVLSQKGDAYENGGNGWHDNFAFEDLTRQEGMLINQLREINGLLAQARVVSSKPDDNTQVKIGHLITLEDDDKVQSSYQIVGYGESDLTA